LSANRKAIRLGWIAGSIVILLAVSSLLPTPFSQVRQPQTSGPLLATAQADPATLALVKRACSNCHSNETVWPWYSRIAPASWLVERDVQAARKAMNLSRWPEYGSEGQHQLLELIDQKLEAGEMPPARYLALHPEARLNMQEKTMLRQWSQDERKRGGSPASDKRTPAP
jgi:hypothetical protein